MAKQRTLGELVWKITGDTTDVNRKFKQTNQEAQGLGTTVKNTGSLIQSAFKGAAFVAVTAFTKTLITAASEAEETRNKFNVTFSSISEQANAAAENLQESFGLSSQASQQLLSDTGDLLRGS